MNPLVRNLCVAAYNAVHAKTLDPRDPLHLAIIEASAAWMAEEARGAADSSLLEISLPIFELVALIRSAADQGRD